MCNVILGKTFAAFGGFAMFCAWAHFETTCDPVVLVNVLECYSLCDFALGEFPFVADKSTWIPISFRRNLPFFFWRNLPFLVAEVQYPYVCYWNSAMSPILLNNLTKYHDFCWVEDPLGSLTAPDCRGLTGILPQYSWPALRIQPYLGKYWDPWAIQEIPRHVKAGWWCNNHLEKYESQ